MTKDQFYGKTAFYLSLGFWIPMFNIGLALVSIYFAVKALRLSDMDRQQFGGRGYATAALVISVMAILASALIFALYGYERIQCA